MCLSHGRPAGGASEGRPHKVHFGRLGPDDCDEGSGGGPGGACVPLGLSFLSVLQPESSKYLSGVTTVVGPEVDAAVESFSKPTNAAAEVIYPAFSAAGVCGSICSGLSLSLRNGSFSPCFILPSNTTLIILSKPSCPSEKEPRGNTANVEDFNDVWLIKTPDGSGNYIYRGLVQGFSSVGPHTDHLVPA